MLLEFRGIQRKDRIEDSSDRLLLSRNLPEPVGTEKLCLNAEWTVQAVTCYAWRRTFMAFLSSAVFITEVAVAPELVEA